MKKLTKYFIKPFGISLITIILLILYRYYILRNNIPRDLYVLLLPVLLINLINLIIQLIGGRESK